MVTSDNWPIGQTMVFISQILVSFPPSRPYHLRIHPVLYYEIGVGIRPPRIETWLRNDRYRFFLRPAHNCENRNSGT